MSSSAIQNFQPAANTLSQKTYLITGASSGIGRALALRCAALGATVILLGKNLKKLESVYDAIETAGGPQPAIYELNLQTASAENYTALAQALETEFPVIDGLIHNAAQLDKLISIQQHSPDSWQKTLQVNLTAPFLLTRALLPQIQKSKAGRIIFTTSSVGHQGRAFWGAYAVSKAACENLMQVLADELDESSIRVNAINPGATATAMRAGVYPAENPTTLKSPDEILGAYLYLLSEDGETAHGQIFQAQ